MTDPLSHHEALIYVMVTMSAVDRKMSDVELRRIGQAVSNLPVFRDFHEENLVQTAEACGEILGQDGGLDRVLDMVVDALPERLKETAYALALEVAAADLEVEEEEARFLELLQERLGLQRLIATAIERGIRARHVTL